MKFIRMHGRIIPIRDKNEIQRSKDQAKAAAGTGAGLLGAAATGHVAGELHRKAARADAASIRSEIRAAKVSDAPRAVNKQGQMSLFGVKSYRTRQQYMNMAARHADKGEKLRAAAKLVQKAGHHAAGAAVGASAYKLLGHTKLKDDEKTKAAVGVGSGVATSFAIEHAINNKMGANLSFGKMVKSGLKTAATNIGRFAIRKL